MAAVDAPKPATNEPPPDVQDGPVGEAAQMPAAPSHVPDVPRSATGTSTAASVATPSPASGDKPVNPNSPPAQSGAAAPPARHAVADDTEPPPYTPAGRREVFIAVMGMTGAGKSSFINLVTGRNLTVGDTIFSCTQEVERASATIDKTWVTLIDTPGFDDSIRDDGEILGLISAWLGVSYDRKELLSGVILLHDITQPKVRGGDLRTLETIKRMCGSSNFKNVALVTTFWDVQAHVSEEAGRVREEQLKKENTIWARMIEGGAKHYRHYGEKDAALDIVRQFLPKPPVVLQIQNQLSSDLPLGETEPGRYVKEYLQRQRKLHEEYRVTKLDDTEEAVVNLAELSLKITEDIATLQKTMKQILKEAKDESEEEEKEQKAGTSASTDANAVADATDAGKEASKAANAGNASKAKETTLALREAKSGESQPKRKPFLRKIRDMLKWMDQKEKPS